MAEHRFMFTAALSFFAADTGVAHKSGSKLAGPGLVQRSGCADEIGQVRCISSSPAG